MQKTNNLITLFLISTFILIIGLNGRELWSLETRWANIVLQMIQSQDYFHPFLKGESYYDKPLLSYWIIILFSKIFGGLSEWSLRLPSVFAALGCIYFSYAIGEKLFDKQIGLITGFLLATTYYFIFWGRVASADMLNLLGILAATWWFFKDPKKISFLNYLIFFQIIAMTCLCKGLIGIVLPALILLPYLIINRLLLTHLNLKLFLALIPAVMIYLAPFYFQAETESLNLVLRENFIRFFAAFDHKNPFYTYFIYLPVYTLPWTPVFIWALIQTLRNWKQLAANTKWLLWVILILFVFFTASGSRRSYYVLPLIPFAQLLTALQIKEWKTESLNYLKKFGVALGAIYLLIFGIGLPWFYAGGGLTQFGDEIRNQASLKNPWEEWQIVLLEIDNKVPFYVQTAKPSLYASNIEEFKAIFNTLNPSKVIVIAQEGNKQMLQEYLSQHQIIQSEKTNGECYFSQKSKPAIAFIPQNF